MSTVSLSRRIAALASIPLFVITIGVLVFMLTRHIGALALGLVSIAIAVVGGWWMLTERGILRTISPLPITAGLGFLVVSVAMVFNGAERIFVRSAILIGLFLLAITLARYSLSRPKSVYLDAVPRRPPPAHPVLLCNPWSGGGKVESFGLRDLAAELGVEVVMLDHGLDLEQLTRDAVARGADCLGMAGGDGSQALVASVAVEHDLPFVCIPAGTRNHFALDLGLDRTDPRKTMYAFRDAIERRVDYATVNNRLFVNNVSLGIYATIVQSDDYRDAKAEVSVSMARDLLGRQSEPFDLQYSIPEGREIDGAFLIMVSNNPYVLDANPAIAQRHEVDGGKLGVFALSTRTGGQAGRLMTLSALGLRDLSKYWWEFEAEAFEVRSRSGSAYMGVDGEALDEPTPLVFRIHPKGLRMYVPEGNLEAAEQRRARDLRAYRVVGVAFGREPTQGVPA